VYEPLNTAAEVKS